MKKKLVSLILAAIMAVPATTTLVGCSPRDEVLRIYNWGDYIEESLLDQFVDWYKEETGKNIEVEYNTFETNEDMLMRIEVLKSDYDLVCPSDYMAERMIKNGLAQKVDKSIFDVTEEGFLYDGLVDMITPFDENLDYYVPYCWGTCGIMYDTDHIDAGSEKIKSWEAVWSSEYDKRVLMKDSVRDAYSVARIYKNREKLSALSDGFTDYSKADGEYRKELMSYFSQISDESIKEALDTLVEQKTVLYKYEVDDGKNDMLAGTTKAWLGMFWSCDVGLIMQENGGDHFYYEVPKEGSNVWVDGWLIPKYAGNVTAANYFLKFINLYNDDYDFAMQNFDYMGTSMAGKDVMAEGRAYLEHIMYEELSDEEIEADELAEEDIEYAKMMYSRDDWFKTMYLEMMFPSPEVLARCGVMRDFGKKWATELDSMWVDVKTI